MSAHDVLVPGPNGRTLKPTQRVGFDTLPDQFVNKEMDRGFRFNLLCVGETGVGKTTLLESIFKTEFPDAAHDTHDGGPLHIDVFHLKDGGVELDLTLISTIGFGDQMDKTEAAEPIINYLDQQFDSYLQEELRVTRNLSEYADTRVHACLYMLPPTGGVLRKVDLLCLNQLSTKVNVIPVIAKSDTITAAELQKFKVMIRTRLEEDGIQCYAPCYTAQDVVAQLPFAVTASRDFVQVAGEKVRARVYPWGLVEIENEMHSDFTKLRSLLLRSEMEPLLRRTHAHFYENFRRARLRKMGFSDTDERGNPVSWHDAFEAKRNQHMLELSKKEDDMRQSFVLKVKQKEKELKQAETELTQKFEKLRKIHLEEQNALKAELEALELEKREFQLAQQEAALEQAKKSTLKKEKKK